MSEDERPEDAPDDLPPAPPAPPTPPWEPVTERLKREGWRPPPLTPEEAALARASAEALSKAKGFAVTGTLGELVTYRDLEAGTEGYGFRGPDGVVTPLHGVAEPRTPWRIGPQRLPAVPPAFPEGTALVPSPFPLQGTLAAIHHAQEGEGWPRNEEGQPFYTFAQPQGTLHVTLGSPVGEPEPASAAAREALWAQFQGLGDLDGDVLMASLVQWLRSRDAQGYAWITGPAVLDYRGIRPRMQADQPGGKRYRAGHRAADVDAIAACFARLRLVYLDLVNVEIREARAGKRPRRGRYSLKTELLHVPNILTQQQLDGREHRVAWQYRPGQWLARYLEAPNEQLALLMQTTLQYDPHNQRWEKRLAKYFLFHLRIAATDTTAPIRRNVGAVLRELGLAGALDRRNPERAARRFEAAMDRLRDDGQLGSWRLTAESQTWWEKRRPTRGWLEDWFGVDGKGGVAVMEVTAPAATVAQYRLLAARAQAAAAPRLPRRRGAP